MNTIELRLKGMPETWWYRLRMGHQIVATSNCREGLDLCRKLVDPKAVAEFFTGKVWVLAHNPADEGKTKIPIAYMD